MNVMRYALLAIGVLGLPSVWLWYWLVDAGVTPQKAVFACAANALVLVGATVAERMGSRK